MKQTHRRRPTRQIELGQAWRRAGDDLTGAQDEQPRGLEPDRLDGIARLEHHQVGAAARLQP